MGHNSLQLLNLLNKLSVVILCTAADLPKQSDWYHCVFSQIGDSKLCGLESGGSNNFVNGQIEKPFAPLRKGCILLSAEQYWTRIEEIATQSLGL